MRTSTDKGKEECRSGQGRNDWSAEDLFADGGPGLSRWRRRKRPRLATAARPSSQGPTLSRSQSSPVRRTPEAQPCSPSSSYPLNPRNTKIPGIESDFAQLFLNAQQLVVLGDTVAAADRSGLDLARPETDGEIGDGSVLRLSAERWEMTVV